MARIPIKSIWQFLICSLLFNLVPHTLPSSSASTEGCPNTWTISQAGEAGVKELMLARQNLGRNMVMDEGTFLYSNFSGELGLMPKPENNSLGLSDLFLYGNTQVSIKYSVQVKDCPGKVDFVIRFGTLKEFYKITATPSFIRTTAKEWATNNSNRFQDFLAQQDFASCISKMKDVITARNVENPAIQIPYFSLSPGIQRYGISFCKLHQNSIPEIGAFGFLMDLSPGCSMIEIDGTTSRRLGISIPQGKTCEFAFAIYLDSYLPTDTTNWNFEFQKEMKTPIYILESFKVTSPTPKPVTITCAKGKIIKKVTAVNPKCPSGYTKK